MRASILTLLPPGSIPSNEQVSRLRIPSSSSKGQCRISTGKFNRSGFVHPPQVVLWGNSLLPPAIVSSSFDPPPGQEPYSLVFDFTGDVAYDRPEKVGFDAFIPHQKSHLLQVQIKHTCNIARLIGEEAARRNVKAYVRLQQPWYETSDKGSHSEQHDYKPYGVIGTWWHESLRILGAIEGCVRHLFVLSFILNSYQPQPCCRPYRPHLWALH